MRTAPALAQSVQVDPAGPTIGHSRASRWQIGMIVTASGGACHDLTGYVPVPTDWPEQHVSTVKEDISPEAKINYEMIDGGVMVMNVQIAACLRPDGQGFADARDSPQRDLAAGR